MALDNDQIKAVEAASGHSVFGSSSLPRIIDCPASVGEELKAGLKPTSIFAAKGTELHAWTEKALPQADPYAYIHKQDIDIEDMTYILDAIAYVQKIFELHPSDAVMELELGGSLASYGLPEVYGTMDVVIRSRYRTDVIDHKFGHGVAVYAKENYQLVSYLGMAVPFEAVPPSDHELYVHINQPPLNIYDEWRVDWDVMYQMILGDVTDAIAQARSDNPPFGPTVKACKFCNANMGCAPRHKALQKQAALVQEMARNPSVVPNEKWAAFLEAAESLKSAIPQVEKYAVSEIQSGNPFPGFKLIAGRANRKFVDEEAGQKFMAARLGRKAYKPQEYITLAQAEKLDKDLKKNDDWNNLIHKPQGKPKLVKESAKGTALVYGTAGIMDQIAKGEL